MTRTFGLLATTLAVVGLGCCNTARVRDAKAKPRPDDPRYTIEEQKRRARDKFAFPDDDFRAGPRSGSELPGGVGR